jgi:hypothetical protein
MTWKWSCERPGRTGVADPRDLVCSALPRPTVAAAAASDPSHNDLETVPPSRARGPCGHGSHLVAHAHVTPYRADADAVDF